MTIQERAREYAVGKWGRHYTRILDIMHSKEGYIKGASDQLNIDIEKACNFLCDTCHASYANDCKNKPCELKTGLIETMKGE